MEGLAPVATRRVSIASRPLQGADFGLEDMVTVDA
jgi:hypothetical protein